MTAQPVPRLTAEEYLAIERDSETKHEFYRGEMFAMAGASRWHVQICSNVVFSLMSELRDRDCNVLANDMRVAVNATGLYTYPDVIVTCEHPEFADEQTDTLLNPQVIIEVLSPTTESYDRGKKFDHYRQIESLKEYLLVSQEAMHVERFVKQADGRWLLDEAKGPEGVIELASVDARLSLGEVYRRVEFDRTDEAAAGIAGP